MAGEWIGRGKVVIALHEYQIVVIPGAGIGPELVHSAVTVLAAVQKLDGRFRLALDERRAGAGEYRETGQNISDDTLAATADDTVRTSVYDQVRGAPFPEGIADRVLRNAFNTAWEGCNDDIAARQADLLRELEAGAQRSDPTVVDISAGVAVGLIPSLEPAGAIVRHIVKEAERVLCDGSAVLLR